MRRIRIGVLGCADIANRLVIPSIIQSKQFELIAVSSRSAGKAQTYADKFGCDAIAGYEGLIDREDIEAIYMPLPTGLHYEWGIKCLQAGKHLLSEKSLASTYSEASQMVKTAQKQGKNLLENFMFEHHSQHTFVKQKLREGLIGDMRVIRSSFGFPPFKDKENIRYNKSLGGGALLDAGAYTVKVSQMFLGLDIDVKGVFLKHDQDLGVDISGTAILADQNDVFVQASWGFENFYECSYQILGSEGRITTERAYTAPPGFKPKIIVEKQDQRKEYFVSADNHFVKILDAFYNSIISNDFEENYLKLLNQAKMLDRILNYDKTT